MKTVMGGAACCLALLGLGRGVASAQTLETQLAGFDLRANGALSVQAGAFKDVSTGISDEDAEWDGSLVLTAERITKSGLLIGGRAEIDTGDRVAEDLTRDEIYVYVAGGFGRVEFGEQDGAADSLSLHAPIVGLGQVRGDFVRYTGTAALLSPFDSRDALKIVYLSAPWRGARFGASYAPTLEANEDDPAPRRRTVQENAYEIAAAYQAPIGNYVLGLSAAYVGASADPITERGDIASWSVGAEVVRGPWTVGGAYVSRGDSNSLVVDLDEDEWNIGAAYRDNRWGAALSIARTESSRLANRLIGIGGYYDLNEWWVARADFVTITEETAAGFERDGRVGIVEVSFRF